MAKIDKSNDPVNKALPMTVPFWRTLAAGLMNGSNYAVDSNPGMAKTGQSADILRVLVAKLGGIFYGPGRDDVLVVDRAFDGAPKTRATAEHYFRLAGDPRCPAVVEGHVPLVIKYVFCPGLLSSDFYGLPVPVRPQEMGMLAFDPVLRTFCTSAEKGAADRKVYGANGGAADFAVFTRPAILDGIPVPTATGTVGRVIIVLDELKKVPEMFPVAAGAIHNKVVGAHRIYGEHVGFLVTGNFEQSGAGAHRMTSDLLDRLAVIPGCGDAEGHMAWLRGQDWVPPEVLGFLSADQTVGDRIYRASMAEPANYCSPRGITDIARTLVAWSGEGMPFSPTTNGVQNAVVIDRLGDVVGRDFIAFCALGQQLPDFDKTVSSPGQVKLPDTPSAQLYWMEVLASKATPENIEQLAKAVSRCGTLQQHHFTGAVASRFQAANDAALRTVSEGRSSSDAEQARLRLMQKIIELRDKAQTWGSLIREAGVQKRLLMAGFK